jgi:hypothetical protein
MGRVGLTEHKIPELGFIILFGFIYTPDKTSSLRRIGKNL